MRSFLAGSAMALVLGATGLVVASLTMPPVVDVPAPVAVTPPPAPQADLPAPEQPAPVVAPPPVAAPPVAVDTSPPPPAPMPEPAPEPVPPAAALPEPEPVQPDASVAAPPDPAPQTPDVRINRPVEDATSEPVEEVMPDVIPLVRYAADFDYAADLPLVAVVLLDDPRVAEAPALIAALPFVPSVVLNAAAPDVTARMRAYRAAGIEVLVAANLPQGAQPSDVEITFQAAFAAVPEAVALFTDGTMPETGAVAEQVTAWLVADGRGLVTMPRGLGGMRPAEAGAVPTVQISREVDGADAPQPTIARNLAQASFRARQTGAAVVLARATATTLEAISIWANRSDPGQVSLVPVSAVLISQLPPP